MRRSRVFAVAGLAAATGAVLALDVTGVLRGPLHIAFDRGDFSDTRTVESTLTPAAPVPVLASWTTIANVPPAPQKVAAAVSPALDADALGSSVHASVIDIATGTDLLSREAGVGAIPASTTKVVTAVAALSSLGPDTELATRVVAASATPDELILVGGGDPTLRSSEKVDGAGPTLTNLAQRTAAALKKQKLTTVSLGYDASLFAPPTRAASWPASYVTSGEVAPVMALAVDNGRVEPDERARVSDPAKTAATRFAELLDDNGITVTGSVATAKAATSGTAVAEVLSPPLSAIVERMLARSDNDVAEALGHLVGAKAGDATFSGGARASLGVLGALGIPVDGLRLLDASGLSRDNLIAPEVLVQILVASAAEEHADLRAVLTGLPVGGLNGTLDDRFRSGVPKTAAGDVRAKTGTLTGVVSLAGTVLDADGRLLAFAVMADQVPAGGTGAAEDAIDRFVARLAACGCA